MSEPDAVPRPTATAIIRTLTTLQKLTLDAVRCGTEKELEFLVLNRTAGVVRYDRASLWRLDGRARFAGSSGRGGDSSVEAAWRDRIADELRDAEAKIIAGIGVEADGKASGEIDDKTGDAGNALWLPLHVDGRPYAGLLLERFSPPGFSQADRKSLLPLARGYEGAFRIFAGRGAGASAKRRNLFLFSALAAALALLCFYRLPLRIVAPCEVAPAKLVPVNAPLDGVIREVRVTPGQEVTAGDVLYIYDGEVARRELEASAKQVEVTRSDLERAAAAARTDVNARAEAVMLENRLSLDIVRRDAVASRVEKLTVSAPEAGIVVMDNPAEFPGRPVAVGEAVVKIADPSGSLLRIRLPQDDRITFDPSLPVRVVLNANSASTPTAELSYVAPHATAGDDGVYGFMAEAVWTEQPPGVHLGQKGTAILYGEKAPLGYWLFRKPLATLRGFFGI